uniref:ZF-HD dimerization-type domain-containing protein n=1 Tax=Kalanchoe fedtschenkoi TaxID=63787 RepID=A0A7N0V4N3_KALFE
MRKKQVVVRTKEPSKKSNSSNQIYRYVIYKECQKNQAAGVGGHAVDGCREFMAMGAEETGGADALVCAACGCHRSFHRKVVENMPASFFSSSA